MPDQGDKPNSLLGALKLGAGLAFAPAAYTPPALLARVAASKLVPESKTAMGLDDDQIEAAGALGWGGVKGVLGGLGISAGSAAMGATNAVGTALDVVSGDDSDTSAGRRMARSVRSELVRQEEENPGLVVAGQMAATGGMLGAGVGLPGMAARGQAALSARLAGAAPGIGRRIASTVASGAAVGGLSAALDTAVESTSRQALRDGDVSYEKSFADAIEGGKLGILLGGGASALGAVGSELLAAKGGKIGDFLKSRGANQRLREEGISGAGIRDVRAATGGKQYEYVRQVAAEAGEDGFVSVAKKRADALGSQIDEVVASEADARRAVADRIRASAAESAQASVDAARGNLRARAEGANELLNLETGHLKERLAQLMDSPPSPARSIEEVTNAGRRRSAMSAMGTEDTQLAVRMAGEPPPAVAANPFDKPTHTPGYGIGVKGADTEAFSKTAGKTEAFSRTGIPTGDTRASVTVPAQLGTQGEVAPVVSASRGQTRTLASPELEGISPGVRAKPPVIDEPTSPDIGASGGKRLAEMDSLRRRIAEAEARNTADHEKGIVEAAKAVGDAEKRAKALIAKADREAVKHDLAAAKLSVNGLSGDAKLRVSELVSEKNIYDKLASSSERSATDKLWSAVRRMSGRGIAGIAGGAVGGIPGAAVAGGLEWAAERLVPNYASRGLMRTGELAAAVGGTLSTDAAARGAVNHVFGVSIPKLASIPVAAEISSKKDPAAEVNRRLRAFSMTPEYAENISAMLTRPGMPGAEEVPGRIAKIAENIKANSPVPAIDDSPFSGGPAYSNSEIYRFEDYLSVAVNPSSYFRSLRDGSITPSMTKAMADNWPEIYTSMKNEALGLFPDEHGGKRELDTQAIRRLETMFGDAILPESRKDAKDFYQEQYAKIESTNGTRPSSGGGSVAKSPKASTTPSEQMGATK